MPGVITDHRTAPESRRPERRHPTAGPVLTVVAGVVVWAALAMPEVAGGAWLLAFVRLPLGVLVLLLLAVVLRGRALRIVAVVLGVLIAALALLKGLDIGFHTALDRAFDVVSDWSYLRSAVGVLSDWAGPGWARAAAVGAVVLAIAAFVLLPWAAVRVTRAVSHRRRRAVPVLAVLTAVWVAGVLFGVGWNAGTPAAALDSAGLAVSTVQRLRDGIADHRVFGRQIADDPFADVPADQLLTGLRGKDVLLVFVESYGKVAITNPEVAAIVRPALASADADLHAAGFSARSALLDSPTYGGASWLAHSTVESGLWVDTQQRYDQLVATHRLTLATAFKKAGWRTVFDIPAMNEAWPQGQPFYGFDGLYTALNVGYHGPTFGYDTMPDQYTLQVFGDRELAPAHRKPVWAEIDLLSSHWPWTPPPPLLPWGTLGDGSVYATPRGRSPQASADRTADARTIYAQTIAYTMRTLASFAAHSNDPDLVIIAMGDHQPNNTVTADNAGHEVPAMIIAHDPQVLAGVAGWGWTPGLDPAPTAPMWPMSALRNRILTTFGSGS